MMSRENPTPVYYQVQLELKKQIEEGHWLPGEKIPTEKKLADLYSLSTGTIRQAIMNLVNEGYLYRVAGKGSFVKGTVLRRKNLRYYRMLRHFQDNDEANLTIKFLSLKKIEPGQDHIRCLNLRQNQKIYQLSRRSFIKVGINPVNNFDDTFRNRYFIGGSVFGLQEVQRSIRIVYGFRLLNTASKY